MLSVAGTSVEVVSVDIKFNDMSEFVCQTPSAFGLPAPSIFSYILFKFKHSFSHSAIKILFYIDLSCSGIIEEYCIIEQSEMAGCCK